MTGICVQVNIANSNTTGKFDFARSQEMLQHFPPLVVVCLWECLISCGISETTTNETVRLSGLSCVSQGCHYFKMLKVQTDLS